MKLNNKKIVVTGGAGFLGGYIVSKLKSKGCKKIFVPLIEEYDGVLFINPGSAVQPRGNYPPSIVLLKIIDKHLEPRFVSLK